MPLRRKKPLNQMEQKRRFSEGKIAAYVPARAVYLLL
jgi:hypothetical protein